MFEIGPTDSGVNPEGEAKTGLTGPDIRPFDLKTLSEIEYFQFSSTRDMITSYFIHTFYKGNNFTEYNISLLHPNLWRK